ncbi:MULTISPECIES: class I SAM-dependent methyltransferase [unclassified Nocardioides]|uniref:class I SAM-dependent methyltransferase n=1 Tax=unclassified Nocardioides TaxID=2615069 RepID=UPI0030155C98
MPEPDKQVVNLLRAIRRELVAGRRTPPPSVPVQLRERGVAQSVDYIEAERRLDSAQISATKPAAIAAALRAVTIDGMVAEFGVFQGTSLTQIAQFFDDRTVHGFDSFVGLPESWSGTEKGEGAFDVGGVPPELPVSNVEFHVGFFDKTVPQFATAHQGPFAFVHLDADLYSSTKTVMDTLLDWFVPGTVIVFDEYFGYYGWQNHEHKAFLELLERTGFSYEGISIGHMNLGVRLLA